jgi:hypothetical protein
MARMDPTPARPRRLSPLGSSAVVAAVCAVPGIVLSAWARGLEVHQLLHPALEQIRSASMIAVAASPILTFVLVIRDRRLLGLRQHMGPTLAQLGVALALLAFMLLLHFSLFGPDYEGASVSSPDGQTTVRLYGKASTSTAATSSTARTAAR